MLVAGGHEVLWWASTFDHAHKRHRFSEPHTIDLQPGLKIRLLHGPGYRHNKSPWRFWHNRVLAAAFARESTALQPPDLIFCSLPTPELAEKSVHYGRKKGIPVIVDVRDQWPDLYLKLVPAALRPLAGVFLTREVRRIQHITQAATGLLAVSETYLDWALKHGKRARHGGDGVFPLGYPDFPLLPAGEANSTAEKLRLKYGFRLDTLVITFVGTFGVSYDLESVVRAARLLHTERPDLDVRIVLAGSGDNEAKLHKLATGCPNVVFTGWLDGSSIQSFLRVSSVGLAAYAEEAIQSLPNKPFEYMAARLPLLSSLGGELAYLIQQEAIGLNYSAGDEDLLVEKICWLAENPAERIAMGQRSRKLFERQFSADIIYPKLLAHLERIVTRGLSP
jgi:glycosyltransferase involved in cell wall biosynthesis